MPSPHDYSLAIRLILVIFYMYEVIVYDFTVERQVWLGR
jgi:hypothetical protein